jgi:hypothetical protein
MRCIKKSSKPNYQSKTIYSHSFTYKPMCDLGNALYRWYCNFTLNVGWGTCWFHGTTLQCLSGGCVCSPDKSVCRLLFTDWLFISAKDKIFGSVKNDRALWFGAHAVCPPSTNCYSYDQSLTDCEVMEFTLWMYPPLWTTIRNCKQIFLGGTRN